MIAVGIETDYEPHGPGFDSLYMQEVFYKTFRPAVGPAQPPIQWVAAFRRSFQGVKWLGRNVDHSLKFSGEVTNPRSYTSILCIHLYGMKKRNLFLIIVVQPVNKHASLWNRLFNYRVYNNTPLGLILRQLNAVSLIVSPSVV